MIDYSKIFSRASAIMQGSAIRRMGALGARTTDLISFAPGYPSPDLFAWDDIRDRVTTALGSRDASILQYGPTRGDQRLVAALPHILAERGIQASTDEVIVTTGSQQALDLCARVFIDPGDVVLVELPAYTGAITAFRNAQATLAGVAQQADGVDLDDLDRVLTRARSDGRRVAFLYVVPNFQNPTGLLLSLGKRRALLEWAARRDVLVLEDDPYGALHFDDVATAEDTRPIKADDREGRVVYMSSFSKTLAPGLRVAWITAAAPIVAKIEVVKQAADLCTGTLDQRIVHDMWSSGILNARLPLLRGHYQAKRRVMERALRKELGDRVSWPEPKGGFFLWASFDGVDADDLLERALTHRLSFVAGSAFYVDGRRGPCARLSFSAPTPERIEEGIRRLAAAVHEDRAAHPAATATSRPASSKSGSAAARPPSPRAPSDASPASRWLLSRCRQR